MSTRARNPGVPSVDLQAEPKTGNPSSRRSSCGMHQAGFSRGRRQRGHQRPPGMHLVICFLVIDDTPQPLGKLDDATAKVVHVDHCVCTPSRLLLNDTATRLWGFGKAWVRSGCRWFPTGRWIEVCDSGRPCNDWDAACPQGLKQFLRDVVLDIAVLDGKRELCLSPEGVDDGGQGPEWIRTATRGVLATGSRDPRLLGKVHLAALVTPAG